jgi:hypothetical protein
VKTAPEPEFVNVEEAQESIPRNQLLLSGNRFVGSLKDLQIRAQEYVRDEIWRTSGWALDFPFSTVLCT